MDPNVIYKQLQVLINHIYDIERDVQLIKLHLLMESGAEESNGQ